MPKIVCTRGIARNPIVFRREWLAKAPTAAEAALSNIKICSLFSIVRNSKSYECSGRDIQYPKDSKMPTYIVLVTVNGEEHEKGTFDADDDADSIAKLDQHIPIQESRHRHLYSCKRAEVDALRYYPRMARPQIGFGTYIGLPAPGPLFKTEENGQPPLPHDAASMSSSMNQLTILVRNLEEISRSIEPSQANMQAYGHLIRNTLLLAAMEFENECKGVLAANGYVPTSGRTRWSTADFVKVLTPLRLQEFDVKLSFYPAIVPRKPFQGWNIQDPPNP